MYKLITFLLFSLVISTSVFAQSDSIKYKDVDKLLNRGMIFFSNKAVELLETQYASDSATSKYWSKYALALMYAHKYERSIGAMDKAIQLDPENSHVYYEKARLVFDINKDKETAIKLLDKAISMKPDGEYYFYRGVYYQQLENIEQAIANYDKAGMMNFEHQGLYRNYSILLLHHSNMPEKALEYAEKGIVLDPDIPENYVTRGEAYLFLLEADKACADFEKAKALGHINDQSMLYALCTAENKTSAIGEALALLEKYIFAIPAFTIAIAE